MATVHIERHSLADLHADPPRPVEHLDVEVADMSAPNPGPPPATLSDPAPSSDPPGKSEEPDGVVSARRRLFDREVSDPKPKRPDSRARRLAPKSGEDDAD